MDKLPGMMIPEGAKVVADALGLGNAYLVGGCVRDILMGLVPKDFDMATPLEPFEVIQCLQSQGIAYDRSSSKYGTIVAYVDDACLEGYEITTFRKETGYSDSRHPDAVAFTKSLEEDAKRRDFTVNSIYASMDDLRIIDPNGGMGDIKSKAISCVGNPVDRFTEDPIRMLRCARFASMGFQPGHDELRAMGILADLVEGISPERVFSEITKLLALPDAKYGITILRLDGILERILPEVRCLAQVEQNNQYHGNTVLEHTLDVLSMCGDDPVLNWAALLHDAGKITVRTTDKYGYDHFYGHPKESAKIADIVLGRLNVPNRFKDMVVFCVREHDTRFEGSKNLMKKVAKWMCENIKNIGILEECENTLYALQMADIRGQHGDVLTGRRLTNAEEVHKVRRFLLSRPHRLEDLSIDGNDMMDLGVEPKAIPEMKKRTLQAMMLGDAPDRDSQLTFVKRNRKVVNSLAAK